MCCLLDSEKKSILSICCLQLAVDEADAADGTGNVVVVVAAAAGSGFEVVETAEQLTKCALLDYLGKMVGQLQRKQSL